MGYIISKIKDNIRKYGLLKLIKRGYTKISNIILGFINNLLFSKKYSKQLNKILEENANKKIIVFYPFFDFNMPNFQRFQQIAMALGAQEEVLFFYCTPNNIYDHIFGFKHINKNLYVTNQYNLLIKSNIKNRILYFVSTDVKSSVDDFTKAIERNDKIIYDYVDDMHEDIIGNINEKQILKHNFAIKNENIIILATADKLFQEVKKIRKRNVYLVTNGVKIEDFIIEKNDNYNDEKLTKLLTFISKYTVTICYYGALAKWFDYDLVKYIAKDKKVGIILIGVDYDMSIKKSNLLDYENVLFLGTIPYGELKYYASKCDIMTIPFVINDITNATSPVKLFEYMALKKPIITTNMKECAKYSSVNIANSNEEFVKLIYLLKDKIENNIFDYDLVLKEANKNSWKSKAEKIVEVI